MKHQNRCRIAVAALVVAAGTALAASSGTIGGIEALHTAPEGFVELTRQYPGVQAFVAEDRIMLIYGKPMTGAQTPEDAAANWWAEHGLAFGAGALDLEEVWVAETAMGKFTVFGYQQHIDGLPVEYGIGRVMVLNGFAGEQDRVVYAAGKFAKRPEGGFGLPFVQASAAVGSVRDMINFEHLPVWTEAELVVFQGDDTRIDPVLAWKFVGEEPDRVMRERYCFFVDAQTGALIHTRNEVLHVDVIGKLEGMASPGTNPDFAGNPPVMMAVQDMRVVVQGGNNAYSDDNGNFVIPHGGVNPVTVTSNLDNGLWVDVNDSSGTPVLSISGTFTPGVHGVLQYNTSPSQFTTAQVNAAIHTAKTHDYIRYRTSWTGMDFKCPANVNINSSCNAYFDGSSINFYRAGGGCNNTSYSSVVAHEYGHYIVARLGLAQGAFGEGYSDTCSMIQYDDPIVGRNFTTGGGYVRYPVQANVQYPCPGGGVHHCGQLVGGVVWRIRENFGNTYGSATGLTLVQQLHVDWSMITIGGIGNNSAHPATAIEWLTVDDDDGDLGNGSPHYSEICAAFNAHSISCPALPAISISFPGGRPMEFDALSPGQAESFAVRMVAGTTSPIPGTARLHYAINGGGYQEVALVHEGGENYKATMPGVECDALVNYYIRVQGTNGLFYTSPADAPASAHGTGALLFADYFNTDRGWVVGAPDDNAIRGIWGRMKPNQTTSGGIIVQPGAAFLGENCYVTDGRGGAAGDWDVDNGKTTLFSPILDLTGGQDPVVSYQRWFSNHAGAGPYTDVFVVDVSNNGGSTWTNFETVGPTGQQVEGGWYLASKRLADVIQPTSAVRFRFIASDYDPQSLVEALVDDFRVTYGGCVSSCPADFNGDTIVNTLDVLAFLNAYTAGHSSADFNGDTIINTLDVLAFLNAYTAGCD
ncbi:MAG: hypothetical protein KIS87_03230 [Phycisphaeraceae bacterium]|nr:hypothetical protein [Phycisphaeraceae bacterium]